MNSLVSLFDCVSVCLSPLFDNASSIVSQWNCQKQLPLTKFISVQKANVTRRQSLTLWGRVTYICVCKQAIIGSDNGLSPGRCQTIWANTGVLLIGDLGTNFNAISSKIYTFSWMKIHMQMSSANWWAFCLGLNEFRSQRSKIFPRFIVSGFQFADGYWMMHTSSRGIEEVPYCCSRSSIHFQDNMGQNRQFGPDICVFRWQLRFQFTDGYEMIYAF